MAGKKTGKRILTALIVILVLILSLGVLSRLFGGIVVGRGITLTYGGESYKKSVEGLEIAPRSEFGIKLRDKSASYEVKIYASGTEETDFTFTVGGKEYSWQKDIAGANGGSGEDFTDAFEVKDTGFRIACGVEKALRDIWQDEAIELPENIPAGDRFRLEVTSGKNTLTVSFSVKEPGNIGVEKIELSPGEIVF